MTNACNHRRYPRELFMRGEPVRTVLSRATVTLATSRLRRSWARPGRRRPCLSGFRRWLGPRAVPIRPGMSMVLRPDCECAISLESCRELTSWSVIPTKGILVCAGHGAVRSSNSSLLTTTDIVGNNIPVFFIQDAIRFPDLIHSVKPSPDSEIPQAATAHDSAWDFFSSQPSTMHTLFWAMAGSGIPRSYRHMVSRPDHYTLTAAMI